ncbi:LysR family transcriptional regulator [Halovulum sp. GXIMD14794]
MSLDLKSVELFVRAAKLGAIGKAGAEFGLSPTSATQRIQALETRVGAQLFHRTTRAIALSSDGEVFLAHAQRILGDVEDALSELQNDPESIRGELRVAGAASLGRKHIAPYMAEFLARYPNVSVQLHLSDSVTDVVESGFDLAIRLGSLAPSTLMAQKLADSPRVMVAAPDYLDRYGVPETAEDLKAHECLLREEARCWTLKPPTGPAQDVRVQGRFSSNLAEAITEATLSGLGIARKCRWEVEEYLQSGDLATVLDDHVVMPEWEIYAVRPPSRLQPPRVRAFSGFLKDKLKGVPALTKT